MGDMHMYIRCVLAVNRAGAGVVHSGLGLMSSGRRLAMPDTECGVCVGDLEAV